MTEVSPMPGMLKVMLCVEAFVFVAMKTKLVLPVFLYAEQFTPPPGALASILTKPGLTNLL